MISPSIFTPQHPEHSKVRICTLSPALKPFTPPSSQLINDNPTIKGEYAIELLCKSLARGAQIVTIGIPSICLYDFICSISILPAKYITNIRFSLCPDSHFAHGQFRNCTAQTKNSHSVSQFRNSHFAQSDSRIVQILTLRRTYKYIVHVVLNEPLNIHNLTWSRGYKPFSCSTQLSMNFIMACMLKYQQIRYLRILKQETSSFVGILVFMSN